MVLQHSRRSSRVGADGRPVLLADQDRRQWHHDEIAEGLRLLDTAIRQRSTTRLRERLAPKYRLEALIAAAHATSPTPAATDWPAIAAPVRRAGGADRFTRRAASTAPSPSPRPTGRPPPWRCSTASTTCSGDSKDLAVVRGELLDRLGRQRRGGERLRRRRSPWRPTTAERAHLERRRVAIDGTLG